jgi:hypothetical protein
MNSLKERLQMVAVVFVLGMLVFCLWYLLFYMPGKMAEPEGTLVYVEPRKLDRL